MKKIIFLMVFIMFVSVAFVGTVPAQDDSGEINIAEVFEELEKEDEEPGIIKSLKEMDREDLEWLVLLLMADSLKMDTTDELLDNPDKAEALLKRMNMKSNDELAISTLRAISTATETYYVGNNDKYPQAIEDLTGADVPYLNEKYCGEIAEGFKYDCDFSPEGYKFIASPATIGMTGSKIFEITTGGVLLAK